MQSQVGDINTAINLYRLNALSAYRESNKDLAKTCLLGLNAMLPEDLRLIQDYEEAIKEETPDKKIQCAKCEALLSYENKLTKTRHAPKYYFGDLRQIPIHTQQALKCKCGNLITFSLEKVIHIIPPKVNRRFIRPAPRITNILGDMVNTLSFWDWFSSTWEILEIKHLQNRANVGSTEEPDA